MLWLQYVNFENVVSCSYELPIIGHVKLSRWDIAFLQELLG